MKIRSFRESDIELIDKIWREHYSDSYSVPARDNLLYENIVENKGKLLAYGQVQLIAEGTIILDIDATKIEKTKALILLMQGGIDASKRAKLDLSLSTKNASFALLLEKHFDLEHIVDPGELLTRRSNAKKQG